MKVFSVSQVSEYIKMVLDSNDILDCINIQGEISNCKRYPSGHIYFDLKENDYVISAVMFKSYADKSEFDPESGLKVIVSGKITSYGKTSKYQIIATSIYPVGLGELYLKLEQLKKKLDEEGLFDESHKRELPFLPLKIGVITSPKGAVIRDIAITARNKCPNTELIVFPCQVQGKECPSSVIDGIEFFNGRSDIDVIIIARGGGSIEDLWGFNDENLARVIYDSKIPVVSAIGHETDFTICDYVSDKRAATPTAAAEICLPSIEDILLDIEQTYETISKQIEDKIYDLKETIESISGSKIFSSTDTILTVKRTSLNMIKSRFLSLSVNRINNLKNNISEFGHNLDSVKTKYSIASNDLEHSEELLLNSYRHKIDNKKLIFENRVAVLNTLNPLSVLNRGYSLSFKGDRVVKSATDIKIDDHIFTKYKDGYSKSIITEVIYDEGRE